MADTRCVHCLHEMREHLIANNGNSLRCRCGCVLDVEIDWDNFDGPVEPPGAIYCEDGACGGCFGCAG